jgi:hypothetical protein
MQRSAVEVSLGVCVADCRIATCGMRCAGTTHHQCHIAADQWIPEQPTSKPGVRGCESDCHFKPPAGEPLQHHRQLQQRPGTRAQGLHGMFPSTSHADSGRQHASPAMAVSIAAEKPPSTRIAVKSMITAQSHWYLHKSGIAFCTCGKKSLTWHDWCMQRVGTYLGAITTGQNASEALNAALSLFPDQAGPSAAPQQTQPPVLASAGAAPAHAPARPAPHNSHEAHSPRPHRESKRPTPTPTPTGRHLLQVKTWLEWLIAF